MGEVYKARDLRLHRTVAIKVLPSDVAGDADLRARFEREAHAIAALDHPNICALYDIGEHDGTHYLVMPHLDGETLAERLARSQGPLPLDQVLTIAIEITDALDKAHRAGITHRDLKPANIMITRGGAKLLDFGLAKLRRPIAPPVSLSDMTRAPTPAPATARGTILGTVHYMAPEQVEGNEADTRSDIWALGAVIFEMATGCRPFDGATPASVIGAILKDNPAPISSRQPLAPPALEMIVEGCLAKAPDDRWQSAADIRRNLVWVRDRSARPEDREIKPAWSRWWNVAAAVAVVIAGLAVAAAVWRSAQAPPDIGNVLQFTVTPPPNTVFASAPATLPAAQLAVSPDGKTLAFVAEGAGGEAMLWVRPLDGVAPQPISGTEGASYPFWSPDSRAIAYFANAQLRRVDVAGGPPQTLCDVMDPRGGAWGPNDVILFSSNQTAIQRVSAAGGTPAAVTQLDPTETGHRWPSFLPDGQHFLYLGRVRSAPFDHATIHIASLASGHVKRLFVTPHAAAYVHPGQILSLSHGTLVAQPFDLSTLSLTGEPTVLARDVAGSSVNYASFSASSTGVLTFARGTVSQTQLAWYNRDGTLATTIGPPGDYADVQLSPDNRRAAVTRMEPNGVGNIWLIDLTTRQFSPLTFDTTMSATPVWAPDGTAIAYRSTREIPAPIFRRLASGAGDEQLVLRGRGWNTDAGNLFPTDWSHDGKFILFHTASARTSYNIWMLPLDGDRTPRPLVRTAFTDMHARLSPDGRFVAYSSAESGRPQIYVQPFPSTAGRWQVSIDGGSEPRWRGDGRELFFVGLDRQLMAVPVQIGATFHAGAASPLFTQRVATAGNPFRTSYAVTRDGQRFLINTVPQNAPPPAITVVVNWPRMLGRADESR